MGSREIRSVIPAPQFGQFNFLRLSSFIYKMRSKNSSYQVEKSGSQSVSLLFAISWTLARQAPLSMKFSRQEYWSGLPFPTPGDLPHPGIKPRSPTLQADYFPLLGLNERTLAEHRHTVVVYCMPVSTVFLSNTITFLSVY